jgi:uncharacterized membrane protein
MQRTTLAPIIGLLCLSSAAARAQATDLPPAGARVRVRSPAIADGALIGRVVSWRGDTLRLLPQRRVDTVLVSLLNVTRLEVSRARRRPWLKYGVLGFAAGAALGAIAGGIVGALEDCEGHGSECGPGFGAAVLGTVGGLVGLVVGTAVGAIRRVDRWEPVVPARRIGAP